MTPPSQENSPSNPSLGMLRKIWSFFWTTTTSRESLYNGTLYTIYRDGKKLLNTKNANYSFGSLQRIMRFAFKKADYSGDGDILLLGLGAGSVPDIIRRELGLKNGIVAVDIDPVIIEVAREEFGYSLHQNITTHCMDATEFVSDTKCVFGLIIIDLFIDNTVPGKFFENAFWDDIARILEPDGRIIFNTISSTTEAGNMEKILESLTRLGLSYEIFKRVTITNTLIIAKR